MREPKFRAIRLDNNEWAHGFFARSLQPDHYLIIEPRVGYGNFNRPIDAETLGEFTGLKDCNGVEIYEGDIVRSHNGSVVEVIEWDSCKSKFISDSKRQFFGKPIRFGLDLMDFLDTEIIGNIHENLELLEAGE